MWTRALAKILNARNQYPVNKDVGLVEKTQLINSLFRVVCRISEDPWVKPLQKPIGAPDDNAVLPCFKKFIVYGANHLKVNTSVQN